MADAPSRSPRPRFVGSALRILDLSLGQMLWSRRSVFLALLTGGPVLLALLISLVRSTTSFGRLSINGAEVSGPAIFGIMMWLIYIRFVVPVLGVFYGTALIADEVEDKTITYLFTRPIARGAVLVGKYLAYLLCAALLLLPSVMVVYFLIVPIGGGRIGRNFPSLLIDLGVLIAGLASYGALFALVGARLKRPLVMGLVFAFGWEPAVLLFPGYLKRATVAYYLQSLVPHVMPNDSTVSVLLQVFREVPTAGASLLALAVITVGALWMAARAVETREYILEQ
jgi:ABC-type transport system involved in multi-copper enzyme maturation permease subunit